MSVKGLAAARPAPWASQIARIAALCLLSVVMTGCGAAYLARAAYEEGRILLSRKPINQVLAQNSLPPDDRAKLAEVLKIRTFARSELGLNVGGAYQTIAQVDRGSIVWVVMAASKVSLTPLQWWFPIVGWVPYRGYFKRTRAQAEARHLEEQGYDTEVRPAIAFSSLGFFNDPLLSNLLRLNRVELAGVLIHELFHRTYFLASDAQFDESAATFVGDMGAASFFEHTEGSDSPAAVQAREIAAGDLRFAAFLKHSEAQLLRLYQSGLPRKQILARRPPIFARIQANFARLMPSVPGLARYDLNAATLNNAVMMDYLLYFHDLDNFAALERMHHGNARATIKAIIRLAQSNPVDPFFAVWKTVHAQPRPISHGKQEGQQASAGQAGSISSSR